MTIFTTRGDGIRIGLRARGNCNRVKAGLAVRDEVAIVDDETAAEDAYAKILSARHRRMNGKVHACISSIPVTENYHNSPT